MNDILAAIGALILTVLFMYGALQFIPYGLISFLLMFVAGAVVLCGGFLQIRKFLVSMDEAGREKETLRLTHEEFTGLEGLSGINVEDFKQLVQESRKKLRTIVDVRMRLLDVDATVGLLVLGKLGDDIINEIKRDPKDYRLARSWFNTYLDQTLNIATKFEDTIKTTQGAKRDELCKEFKETVDQLEGSFSKLLEDLRANDLMALKVDMDVLNVQLKN